LLSPNDHLRGMGHKVVVLDPGHGGRDSGARSLAGRREKDFTLDLAGRVRLRLVHAGIEVRLTRANDRALPLSERCRRAANWDADLFVSIHANQAANRGAHGIETYVLPAPGYPSTSNAEPGERAAAAYAGNRYNAANTVLGYNLQRRLLKETHAADRGLKRARFVVLREAPCPAALVECGFLSHAGEANRLASDAYRERLAEGLSNGITDYISAVRRAVVSAP
jgi:N-acetylmuramoyl-L-alanine amidase